MNKAIARLTLPEGYGLEVFNATQPFDTSKYAMKWDGEWHITIEVFRDLGLAFAAVLVLIYVLVVGWFQSFKTPLLIMAAIPFSLVGILPAHAAMGAFFTATSMIGFIAGAGIVVRNSIILVDFIELRLRDGVPLEQAVVDAGAVRFRPMALTAAAVIVGAGVILFDPIFQGLAISLMAGEVASLLLSRMAVPVLYLHGEAPRTGRPDDHAPRHGGRVMSSLPVVRWQCPPKTVLVAVDFGDASARALAIGGVVASAFGARLRALHAERFEPPPYFTLEQIAGLEAERPPPYFTLERSRDWRPSARGTGGRHRSPGAVRRRGLGIPGRIRRGGRTSGRRDPQRSDDGGPDHCWHAWPPGAGTLVAGFGGRAGRTRGHGSRSRHTRGGHAPARRLRAHCVRAGRRPCRVGRTHLRRAPRDHCGRQPHRRRAGRAVRGRRHAAGVAGGHGDQPRSSVLGHHGFGGEGARRLPTARAVHSEHAEHTLMRNHHDC